MPASIMTVVSSQGRRMDLWRAVDSLGEVADTLVQPKRERLRP